jgi:hypothetical protein
MLKEMHEKALEAAKNAANEAYVKYGDVGACGFAWVEIYGVKMSTKLGKEFAKLGFQKSWNGKAINLWNPAGSPVQSIYVKEQGAIEYAKIMKAAGYKAYAASRLD